MVPTDRPVCKGKLRFSCGGRTKYSPGPDTLLGATRRLSGGLLLYFVGRQTPGESGFVGNVYRRQAASRSRPVPGVQVLQPDRVRSRFGVFSLRSFAPGSTVSEISTIARGSVEWLPACQPARGLASLRFATQAAGTL
jgi:hypothetical protein